MMHSVLSPAGKHKAFERDPLGGISLMKPESLFCKLCEFVTKKRKRLYMIVGVTLKIKVSKGKRE